MKELEKLQHNHQTFHLPICTHFFADESLSGLNIIQFCNGKLLLCGLTKSLRNELETDSE